MGAPVWFYELAGSDPVLAAVPLVVKAHEGGGGVLIVLPDAGTLACLDDLLWTFRDDAVVPHGRDDAPHADRQPILLTTRPDRDTAAAFVIRIAAAVWTGRGDAVRRDMVLYDGEDAAQAARAQAAKAAARAAGVEIALWRNDGGGWRRDSAA